MSEIKTLIYNNVEYNNYEIDTDGNIKNRTNGCECKRLITSDKTGKKKYYVCISQNGKTKNIFIHRAIAEAFLPNPNNYKFVVFIDSNYENLSIENLLWCDHISVDYNQRQKRKNVTKVSKRRQKLKDMAVDYMGGCCKICGYNKCTAALEFHHINPNEKDFSISAHGYTKSWETIKKELNKCICVCANCHREIHNKIIDISDYL